MKQAEMDIYLSVSDTIYKPRSCPILSYKSESDLLTLPGEGESQEEPDENGQRVEEREGDKTVDIRKETLKSSCSFQDSGPEIHLR